MHPDVAARRFFRNLDSYVFNRKAKRVVYTQTTISWIQEDGPSAPSVASGGADRYTTHRDYHYLLELDGDDNIIGGEWVEESVKDHPDFLWFSVGRPSLDIVTPIGMKYRDIRELLDASVACRDIDQPTPAPTPALSSAASTAPTPAPSVASSTAPTQAPTHTPDRWCSRFQRKWTCGIWVWCGWDAEQSVCYKK
ncbi:TPA: hypothetical protein N0F65_002549 [Lagenidium giganteum]|uniref:Uncharacterized protein n=1 Tax=Lagenidium giganteum TaxID=4803 RepID=A0AAV2YIV1_9STRA|nr:TPA: hypothetical protein N0F65_002549 [Lagenidium giganteum]